MNRFRILELIGEGTYGKVFKAQERETGAVVAIKKFKQSEDEDLHVRKTMAREIKVLRDYPHQNVVHLREHFRENGKLYLIFDYIDRTLLEELQAVANETGGAPGGLPVEQIKIILFQILRAIEFLHKQRILHRDIKPENLLLSRNGIVKLCDFGFARGIREDPKYNYTDYVSTRWYRAPELLVGDAAYSSSIDLWALGCIFAEMFNGVPLFPGDSDLHTLQLIIETIAADDQLEERPCQELSKKQRVAFKLNPLFDGLKVPTAAGALLAPDHAMEVCLASLLKGITPVQLDFLRQCLAIDGSQRATAEQLLEHDFFDSSFRENFDERFAEMTLDDEKHFQQQSKIQLRTRDDREEIPSDELISDSEEEEDDESDSALGNDNEDDDFGQHEFELIKQHGEKAASQERLPDNLVPQNAENSEQQQADLEKPATTIQLDSEQVQETLAERAGNEISLETQQQAPIPVQTQNQQQATGSAQEQQPTEITSVEQSLPMDDDVELQRGEASKNSARKVISDMSLGDEINEEPDETGSSQRSNSSVIAAAAEQATGTDLYKESDKKRCKARGIPAENTQVPKEVKTTPPRSRTQISTNNDVPLDTFESQVNGYPAVHSHSRADLPPMVMSQSNQTTTGDRTIHEYNHNRAQSYVSKEQSLNSLNSPRAGCQIVGMAGVGPRNGAPGGLRYSRETPTKLAKVNITFARKHSNQDSNSVGSCPPAQSLGAQEPNNHSTQNYLANSVNVKNKNQSGGRSQPRPNKILPNKPQVQQFMQRRLRGSNVIEQISRNQFNDLAEQHLMDPENPLIFEEKAAAAAAWMVAKSTQKIDKSGKYAGIDLSGVGQFQHMVQGSPQPQQTPLLKNQNSKALASRKQTRQSQLVSSEKLGDLPHLAESGALAFSGQSRGVSQHNQNGVPPLPPSLPQPKRSQPHHHQQAMYPKFATNSMQSLGRVLENTYGGAAVSKHVKYGLHNSYQLPQTRKQHFARLFEQGLGSTGGETIASSTKENDFDGNGVQTAVASTSMHIRSPVPHQASSPSGEATQCLINSLLVPQKAFSSTNPQALYQTHLQQQSVPAAQEYTNSGNFQNDNAYYQLRNHPSSTNRKREGQVRTNAASSNNSGLVLLPQVKLQQTQLQQEYMGTNPAGSQSQAQKQRKSVIPSQLSPIKFQNKSYTMLKTKNHYQGPVTTKIDAIMQTYMGHTLRDSRNGLNKHVATGSDSAVGGLHGVAIAATEKDSHQQLQRIAITRAVGSFQGKTQTNWTNMSISDAMVATASNNKQANVSINSLSPIKHLPCKQKPPRKPQFYLQAQVVATQYAAARRHRSPHSLKKPAVRNSLGPPGQPYTVHPLQQRQQ